MNQLNTFSAAVLDNMKTPHNLYSPFEIETLLNDLPESHLSYVLSYSKINL